MDSSRGRLDVAFLAAGTRMHRVNASLSFIGDQLEDLAATLEVDGIALASLRSPRAQHRWEFALAAFEGDVVRRPGAR